MSAIDERLAQWKLMLTAIQTDLSERGDDRVPPASEALIKQLVDRAQRAGYVIVDDYVAFLRTTNGLSWINGILFCGIDPGSFDDRDFGGEDFFRLNEGIDYRPADTLYGTDQGAHILRSGIDGRFRVVDGGGDAVFDEAEHLLDIFVRLCQEQFERRKDRGSQHLSRYAR